MPVNRRGYKRPTAKKPVAIKKVNIAPIGKNSKNPIIRLASGGMAVAAPLTKKRPIRRRGR